MQSFPPCRSCPGSPVFPQPGARRPSRIGSSRRILRTLLVFAMFGALFALALAGGVSQAHASPPTPAYDAIPASGWQGYGECEYAVDSDDVLWIRPANGAASGLYYDPFDFFPLDGEISAAVSVKVPDGKTIVLPGDCTDLFAGFGFKTFPDASLFDTSGVTDMSSMFVATEPDSLDLSSWDVSNVKDMSHMFSSVHTDSLDLSAWNTESLEDAYGMFDGTEGWTGIRYISVRNWKTSKIRRTGYMFSVNYDLEEVDARGWQGFASGADMSYMFSTCPELKRVQGLDGWDVSNVVDMESMFSSDASLENLNDIEGWTPLGVENIRGMFGDCEKLAELDLSGWSTPNLTEMSQAFAGCASLRSLNLGGEFDTTNVASRKMNNAFATDGALERVVLGPNIYLPPGDYSTAALNAGFEDPEQTDIYTGKWINITSPGAYGISADDLFDYYDRTATSGAFAPGTYVWERTGKGRLVELLASVEYVGTSVDGRDVPFYELWTTPEEKALVEGAVATADALVEADDPGTDWTAAETALRAAVDRYDAAKRRGLLIAVDVVHVLKANAAADLSGITYTVSFAKRHPDAEQLASSYREVPDAVVAGSIAFSPSTTAEWDGTEWTRRSSKKMDPSEVFGPASGFGCAGIYLFDVSETASGGSSGDAAKWSWTSAGQAPEAYVLSLSVVNDGEGHLAYDAIAIESARPPAAKSNSMEFSSLFTGKSTLVVEKRVDGGFGDKTHAFPFEITLFLPDWIEGGIADNVSARSATTSASAFATAESGAKVVTYSANLAHGSSAAFEVPVGTRYKVDEKDASANGLDYAVNIAWGDDAVAGTPVALNKIVPAGAGGSFIVTGADGLDEVESVPVGSEVRVIATPDPGFSVGTVSVTRSDDSQPVTVSALGNGVYSFTAPAAPALDISVSFSEPGASIYGSDGELLGQMSMGQLRAASAEIAQDASLSGQAATAFAAYMTADASFVFEDDPNPVKMEYRVIGLNHDPAHGESGITFMAKHALDQGYYMNEVDREMDGGWEASAVRAALNSQQETPLTGCLPSSVKRNAKTVVKISNGGRSNDGVDNPDNSFVSYTQDRFWMPSTYELTGMMLEECDSPLNTKQYDFFAGKGFAPYNVSGVSEIYDIWRTSSGGYVRDVDPDDDREASHWWLRSAGYLYGDPIYVTSDYIGVWDGPDSDVGAIVPCFCL